MIDFTMLAINIQDYILVWFISLKSLLNTEQYYHCASHPQIVALCTKSNHVCHLLEYRILFVIVVKISIIQLYN